MTAARQLAPLADVAGQLAVCERTVLRLVAAGELRAYHVGRAVRIDLASVPDVRRWLPSTDGV